MDTIDNVNLDEVFKITSTNFLNVYDRVKLKEYIKGFLPFVPSDKLEKLINNIINSLLLSKKLDVTRSAIKYAPHMIQVLLNNPNKTGKQIIAMLRRDGFSKEEINEMAMLIASLGICPAVADIIRELNPYENQLEVALQRIENDIQTK